MYIEAAARGRASGAGRTQRCSRLAAQVYRQAMAGATSPNAASVGLHESMGYIPVGAYRAVGWKFGAGHNVGWRERPLVDGDEPPTGHPLDELPPGDPGEGDRGGRGRAGLRWIRPSSSRRPWTRRPGSRTARCRRS